MESRAPRSDGTCLQGFSAKFYKEHYSLSNSCESASPYLSPYKKDIPILEEMERSPSFEKPSCLPGSRLISCHDDDYNLVPAERKGQPVKRFGAIVKCDLGTMKLPMAHKLRYFFQEWANEPPAACAFMQDRFMHASAKRMCEFVSTKTCNVSGATTS